MEAIFVIILVGLAGGVAIGLQSPMASMIRQRLGMFESIFIAHIAGAIAAHLQRGKLGQWRAVPWYVLGMGVFGLVVIAAASYMIPHIGVAGAMTIVVAGQLLVGSLLDHFGLLGTAARSLDPMRLLGLGVVRFGVWLAVK